jgi:predicted nuclease of predicted toxin-antitoxin system
MRILLDESLPIRLKKDFKGHLVKTVPEAGWQGKKNGELLRSMEGKFDVFVTADQNIQYQLNLRNAMTPIIILKSNSKRYENLQKLMGKAHTLLKSGRFERIHRIF